MEVGSHGAGMIATFGVDHIICVEGNLNKGICADIL